jgi:hypothetical protein
LELAPYQNSLIGGVPAYGLWMWRRGSARASIVVPRTIGIRFSKSFQVSNAGLMKLGAVHGKVHRVFSAPNPGDARRPVNGVQ